MESGEVILCNCLKDSNRNVGRDSGQVGKNIVLPVPVSCDYGESEKESGGAILCFRPKNPIVLGRCVSWFKRMVVNEYIQNVKSGLWEPFDRKIWHRNYYDVIVRKEIDYLRIAKYIRNNPQKWKSNRVLKG